jgi:hypothetical protein
MRDYIIGKHRVLKGTGDPQEAKAVEYFKKLLAVSLEKHLGFILI